MIKACAVDTLDMFNLAGSVEVTFKCTQCVYGHREIDLPKWTDDVAKYYRPLRYICSAV